MYFSGTFNNYENRLHSWVNTGTFASGVTELNLYRIEGLSYFPVIGYGPVSGSYAEKWNKEFVKRAYPYLITGAPF